MWEHQLPLTANFEASMKMILPVDIRKKASSVPRDRVLVVLESVTGLHERTHQGLSSLKVVDSYGLSA